MDDAAPGGDHYGLHAIVGVQLVNDVFHLLHMGLDRFSAINSFAAVSGFPVARRDLLQYLDFCVLFDRLGRSGIRAARSKTISVDLWS